MFAVLFCLRPVAGQAIITRFSFKILGSFDFKILSGVALAVG